MDIWDIAYNALLFGTLLVAIITIRDRYNWKILVLILVVANIVETIALLIKKVYPGYPYLYHFYIPFEYLCLAIFYYRETSLTWLKKTILASVVLFLIVAVVLTIKTKPPDLFPSAHFNVEAALLILLILLSFFTSKPDYRISVYKTPLFWLNISMLIFYAGNFFLMGTYNYLKAHDKDLAEKMFRLINTSLQFVLYSGYIISFICLSKTKKS